MFKLIKILNTGVNVPEIEKVACSTQLALDAGTCVLYDADRGEICLGDEIEVPAYIIAKNVKAGDGFALCYRISPEMVFEVPLIGSPHVVHNGLSLELALKSGHGAYAVTDTDGGPAKVYSTEGASKSGDKILITFNV